MTLQELEPQIASVVASLNLSSLNMETLPASPAGRGPTERASRPAPGRAPPVTAGIGADTGVAAEAGRLRLGRQGGQLAASVGPRRLRP